MDNLPANVDGICNVLVCLGTQDAKHALFSQKLIRIHERPFFDRHSAATFFAWFPLDRQNIQSLSNEACVLQLLGDGTHDPKRLKDALGSCDQLAFIELAVAIDRRWRDLHNQDVALMVVGRRKAGIRDVLHFVGCQRKGWR